MAYGMDDGFERGKRGKKKTQIQQPKPEPVKIEKLRSSTTETITVKDLVRAHRQAQRRTPSRS